MRLKYTNKLIIFPGKIDRHLIIQLAVSDFTLLLVKYTPMLVTYSFKRWILGELMCRFISHLTFVPYLSQQVILLLMNVNRATVLLWPLKIITYREVRSNIANFSTAVSWGGLLLGALVAIARSYGALESGRLFCVPDWILKITTSTRAGILAIWTVFLMCPFLFIIIINCTILCVMRRRRETTTKAALILSRINILLTFSQLPTATGLFIMAYHSTNCLPNWYPVVMDLTALLSCAFNPCVYRLNDVYKTRRNLAGMPIRYRVPVSPIQISTPIMLNCPLRAVSIGDPLDMAQMSSVENLKDQNFKS